MTVERRGSGTVPAQPSGEVKQEHLAPHEHAHQDAGGCALHSHAAAVTWQGPGPDTGAGLGLSLVVASPENYTLDPGAYPDPPGGTSPVTNLSGVSVAQTGSHQQTGSHFSLPGFGPDHDDAARDFLRVRCGQLPSCPGPTHIRGALPGQYAASERPKISRINLSSSQSATHDSVSAIRSNNKPCSAALLADRELRTLDAIRERSSRC